MRIRFAIALIGFGIAGDPAAGADLPTAHPGTYSARHFEYGRQHAMLWLYDDQPGVVTRAYWRAPWRHHHYFPATGREPDIGRDEDFSIHVAPPAPAKTFRRSWSNASQLAQERQQRVLPLDDRPPPMRKRPANPD